MTRTGLTLGLGAVALVAAATLWNGTARSADGTMPADVDVAAGTALYADNCAACHGVNLEGQANWQVPGDDSVMPAPPHDETGHTWHHGDQVLFDYTRLGGHAMMAAKGIDFASGMPGFGDQLTDREIWNILAYIKSTWPERIREVQAVRTEGESRRRGN